MLIVDEAPEERRRLAEAARAAGEAAVREVEPAALERALREGPGPRLVVAGVALLEAIARLAPGTMVIATAGPDELAAADLVGAGAFDLLERGGESDAAVAAIRRARAALQAEALLEADEAALARARAELRADEEALRCDEARLPSLERYRAPLSVGVVDELRRCLAPVSGQLEAGAGRIESDAVHAAVLDGAVAARAAARMACDLADALRAEEGGLPASPRRLALVPFLDEVIAAVERLAADFEAALDLAVDPGLVEIEADPSLLRRALENLLECAVRRSRRGRVRFDVTREGDRAHFIVSDGGGPVPERLLANPYDRRARLEGGPLQRGAALAFSRAVAEAHGGTAIARTDGNGIALVLELPLAS